MARSILIAGVCGVGKTSICAELIKRGYKAHDIDDIEGLFEMRDKRTGKLFENYNNYELDKVKYHDWFCDKSKLQELIQKNKEGNVYYCGLASNNNELLLLFDKVILLQASAEVIKKRLSERTNNDFGKTAEVQDWVLSGQDQREKYMKEKGAVIIDADRSLSEVVDEILEKT